MYVTSLHIENLRCFASADLELQYPGRSNKQPLRLPNVNLLLGNNGSGKTTTLKAIAMAMLASGLDSSGFRPYRLIRRPILGNNTAEVAKITAKASFNNEDLKRISRYFPKTKDSIMILIGQSANEEVFTPQSWSRNSLQVDSWHFFGDISSSLLMVGYGATRRVEENHNVDLASRSKNRSPLYQRVASLFENYVSLIPLTAWLPQFKTGNPGRYKQVVNLINRLLPENARFLAELEQGDYMFEINGTPAPFSALSDGYQAYIGWIADMLYHISTGAPKGAKLVETHGIVLVDEIDLHLHPDWQRSVIPTIAKALPNLQFVFTTHSPIVAGSVEKENIYVMENTADGSSIVRQYNESIYGLNAEEILLSSYFNLPTTRAVGFENELKSLSLKAGRGDLKAALAFMQKLAAPSANGTATASEPKSVRKKASATGKPAKKGAAIKRK